MLIGWSFVSAQSELWRFGGRLHSWQSLRYEALKLQPPLLSFSSIYCLLHNISTLQLGLDDNPRTLHRWGFTISIYHRFSFHSSQPLHAKPTACVRTSLPHWNIQGLLTSASSLFCVTSGIEILPHSLWAFLSPVGSNIDDISPSTSGEVPTALHRLRS
jgi:hypothetical protein